jgi:DNA-directed RNA polymerase
MMHFSGRDYIKIDIAGHMGLDKLLWKDRIEWVNDNDSKLESLDVQADKPLLYMKAVRAHRKAQQGIPTGFIMGLDATNSGLQILSVLMGCDTTALQCNVLNSGKREDAYTNCVTQMNQYLPQDSQIVMGDTQDKLSRKDIKAAMMPVFYGSKKRPKELLGEDTIELQAFYDSLYDLTPGAMMAMDLMQSCWNPLGLSHSWTLPDEHHVDVKVMVPVDRRVELDELDHASFTHRTYQNRPQDNGLSLAANICHSLDSYIVREMIRRAYKQGFALLTVHDCFFACPNYLNQVRSNYIEILSELASMTLLQDILTEIVGKPVKVPRLANISQDILQTEYALS